MQCLCYAPFIIVFVCVYVSEKGGKPSFLMSGGLEFRACLLAEDEVIKVS